jgi:N-acyl-D-aspartate/D-glutamate deacylase
MKAILETAMQNGAMGMTTALIYPLGSYAQTPELIEMARVAAKYRGIYASHMRGEGKELVRSVEELIQIAEQGGLPGEVFHFKAAYGPGWGKPMKEAGQHIDAARARGVDVAADLYVYTAGEPVTISLLRRALFLRLHAPRKEWLECHRSLWWMAQHHSGQRPESRQCQVSGKQHRRYR